MNRCRCNALAALFLCSALISGTPAPAFQELGSYREVIPDAYVVNSQCTELRGVLRANAALASALLAKLNKICAAYKVNHDGDGWLTAYNRILQNVRSSVPDEKLPPTLRRLPGETWLVPNQFKTYSLLLFPDATRIDTAQWKAAEDAFMRFGQATGPKHLAIWPADDEVTPNDAQAHERSEFYARKFGLDSRLGPFIAVTNVRPDRWRDGQSIIVVRLGGADPDAARSILNTLRDEIVKDPALSNANGAATTLAFTDVAQHLISFAKAHANLLTVVKSIL